jgi:hypothetical protein
MPPLILLNTPQPTPSRDLPEDWPNLKHAVKVSTDGHLLVQLGALRQAAGAPHVVKPAHVTHEHMNMNINMGRHGCMNKLCNTSTQSVAPAPCRTDMIGQPSKGSSVFPVTDGRLYWRMQRIKRLMNPQAETNES